MINVLVVLGLFSIIGLILVELAQLLLRYLVGRGR